jgi:hypothetical protein
MKLISSIFLSILLLTIILITGCEQGPNTITEPGVIGQQLSKFSLPAGASLDSAILHIHTSTFNDELVNIYGVSSDWDESTVTWNTKPNIFGAPIEGTLTPNAYEWKTVNITALAGKWLDGTYTNFGLLLDQVNQSSTLSSYYSKENIYQPFLEIFYTGGSAVVPDIADAYLSEQDPTTNFNYDVLYTGYKNGFEKQSLLKFDVEYTPEEVCETAFAFDGDTLTTTIGTCFSQYGFDRWGWSIYLAEPGTYTFPVYAGAGQCDITKGTYVGTVTAVYSGGTVSFTYNFEAGFSSSETHFYAGTTTVARDNKGKPTVAPGQYKIGTGLGDSGVYIIAHAVVCSSDWD